MCQKDIEGPTISNAATVCVWCVCVVCVCVCGVCTYARCNLFCSNLSTLAEQTLLEEKEVIAVLQSLVDSKLLELTTEDTSVGGREWCDGVGGDKSSMVAVGRWWGKIQWWTFYCSHLMIFLYVYM